MSLTLRIFSAYVIIVLIASVVFLNSFMSEIKPGIRQSTEHSLIDTANLLAALVGPEFYQSPNALPHFSKAMNKVINRQYGYRIYNVPIQSSNLRIYITDADGIVRFDTSGKDIGSDYSQWNDVYLTLRGEYGARSTKSDPNDELSSVMHVAAPVMHDGEIIGSLTIAKPNVLVQPFIDRAHRKIIIRGGLVVLASLLIAFTIVVLLTRSVKKLVTYADNVSQSKPAVLPKVYESELSKLALSIENMKSELEGKDYVENYVHTLTHELKSPIAAIKGASELLTAPMPAEQRLKFVGNIEQEITRMDTMVTRLLQLVAIEKQGGIVKSETVSVQNLVDTVIQGKKHLLIERGLNFNIDVCTGELLGDQFLLTQALDNLILNAIAFAHEGSDIRVQSKVSNTAEIQVTNTGELIPEYALDRIFERFYSLPRPDSRQKSTGLGLCFVKQIAVLHQGEVIIENVTEGVRATLKLPIS
ncbi:two-component system sensor histidine kinase CreC [Alteromonas sp. KUL49]|uniref:two-component system sensor histidine kinase CreC n=1 Tax=Alteromonas sp. KUL49 TaxID=2480798 RepID=UPI00102EE785|nr:two-component system sensor histidine kinase CreC [Alteromonas sp. KUL49]TAP41491.1 two-component system sensor histidine kinase CreC [Alteromonas sp. KUL49]GEA10582.1 sensor histidine kinase [Alteromonas sp. KUL49]